MLTPPGSALDGPFIRGDRVIDLFEEVQRHELAVGNRPPVVFTTELTRLQCQILCLLGMSGAYGT